MKKISRRALICLILCIVMLAGVAFFCVEWAVFGKEWATADFNRDIYKNGLPSKGRVLDRDGAVLSDVDSDGNRRYSEDVTVRKATLHAVGDRHGNISIGALHAYSTDLIGYNRITGLNSGKGNDLYLTLNSEWNKTAYNALGNRKGTVFIYNYKTGEILCMVSTPSYDPDNEPADLTTNEKYEGVFLNRAISGLYTPGSTMKTVTMAAALEKIDDMENRTWLCEKKFAIGADHVTCAGRHGTLSSSDALVHSCNAAFAQITLELGKPTLKEYFEKAGLTSSYDINGVASAKGSLGDPSNDMQLAWSGIGQADVLVNPLGMAVYMGAVANGGKAAVPQLVYKINNDSGRTVSKLSAETTGTLIEKETAEKLSEMMRQAVTKEYGAGLFPNLDAYAKSGTAEVANDSEDALFVGFLKDEEYPYAFAVVVEDGGSGTTVAGRIASTVIKQMTGN